MPTARAFRCSLAASARAGRAAGIPSVTLERPFSAILSASQLAATCVGGVRGHVPEDVGVPRHQLVVDAPGHVGQGEPPRLGGQGGVEVHLEQQVAELLFEMGHRARLLGPARPPARRGRPDPRGHRRRDAPARRWPPAPRRTPRAGGGPASRGSGARSHGHRAAGCGPARRAGPAPPPPARPAAGSTARSGGRARRTGRARPTPPPTPLVGQPEVVEDGHRIRRGGRPPTA